MLESVFEVRLEYGAIRFFMLFFFGALVVTEGAVVVGIAVFGSEVTTAFASFLSVFFAIAAVFPIAVVTAIVAVAVIFPLAAAMDAEGGFFGNLDGRRVRFFGEQLDSGCDEGRRVIVGQELFGIFFVAAEIAFFSRSGQVADSGLLGSF